jgi:uncharacterized protein
MKEPRNKPHPEAKHGRICPICGEPAIPDHHPFCSRRCAQVDLHRWLSGRYVIPGRADEADDADGADDSSQAQRAK